jgi:hypothetical protein
MSPFQAAFSPAKYDWDDALLLNCLQWVFENGALPFNLTAPCGFQWFAKASGTEMEADLISMRYLHQPNLLLAGIIASDGTMMSSTLLNLFVPGMVETPILIDTADLFCAPRNRERALDLITAEIAALRVRLFSSTSPSSSTFQPAFSPAKYGWDDALRLNCLQWALENGSCPFAGLFSNRRVWKDETCCWSVFSRASGSELEACFLVFGSLLHPSSILSLIRFNLHPSDHYQSEDDMPFTLLDLFAPGMVETPVIMRTVFSSDFRQKVVDQFYAVRKQDHALSLIAAETAVLRLRLYHRPRAVAFLLGRRLPGSAVSGLSEDVCRMILRFAE